MANQRRTISHIVMDFVEVIIIGTAIVAFTWILLIEPLEVSQNSMVPTLLHKEIILAEKVSIRLGEPERGDILIFSSPQEQDKLLVKRVVGLPGDEIQIRNDQVYLNGNPYNESYIEISQETRPGEVLNDEVYIVPTDSYVLLGDNRENSTDSRDFGAVNKENIIGKAIMVVQPTSNLRIL